MPKGWSLDRIGYPEIGDYYLAHTDVIYQHHRSSIREIQHPVAILSRKAHWVRCTAAWWDGGQEPVKARFRTLKNGPWEYGILVDYRPGQMRWKSSDGRWHRVAERWKA